MKTLYQPLNEGAKLSILDSYFRLMQFSLRHSLTKQAFSDLLNVIGAHLPAKPTISAYRLKKFILALILALSAGGSYRVHVNIYCCTAKKETRR